MPSRTEIQEFATQVAQRYSPQRIILFGSQANNTSSVDSDVDLLVVLDHNGRNVHKAIDILVDLDPRFPIDLLVRTPADIESRVAMNDFFIRNIVEKGVVLYDGRGN